MLQTTRQCKNCKTDFKIEPEDFDFYKKIKVPPPKLCWRCRLQRRLAHRSAGRPFYKVKCKLCGEEVISVHPPNAPFTLYCPRCWYGDGWEPMDYGAEYDFSKPFFQQFAELIHRVPRQTTRMRNSPGSRYCESATNCKNCYMLIGGYNSQDCMYGEAILSRSCVDCTVAFNADHAYENLSVNNAFNTKFAYFSEDCLDSSFLFDCKGCSNCFGGVNLRNKSYHIFNKQYTKEEYKKVIDSEWDIGSYATLQKAKEKFGELLLATPRRFAILNNVTDVVGDDLQNTKNCKVCFLTKDGVENCKYIYYAGLLLKDSYDVTAGGDKSQLLYDSVGCVSCERVFFSNGTNNCHNVAYSEQVFNSSNLFGCVNLKNKRYCILNRQYTKEEYEKLVEKIKKHMGEDYGEFFPMANSVHPYNESWAFEHFPMTREEATRAGYAWRDREQTEYKPDIKTDELPDHIKDAPDDLANKIVECAHRGECNQLCTTAFRIIPDELQFYKKVNVALPRLCPNCRYFERVKIRNPLQLWNRKCAKCGREFQTAVSPERPDIIYCQECYAKEFL